MTNKDDFFISFLLILYIFVILMFTAMSDLSHEIKEIIVVSKSNTDRIHILQELVEDSEEEHERQIHELEAQVLYSINRGKK